jgi:hypothetical protein
MFFIMSLRKVRNSLREDIHVDDLKAKKYSLMDDLEKIINACDKIRLITRKYYFKFTAFSRD